MSFRKGNSIRIALATVGFLSTIFAPPWVSLLAIACLALRYPAWEALLIGLLMDLLWLAPREGISYADFFYSLPLFTIAAIAMVWGFEPLRREFLFGDRTLL